jgi:hypothetical protein
VSDHGPAADAGLACPFVAFADDRDSRSTRPDHRHRCYAEARPAPRATAHQEAYCLAAGFARCPTFVDWARREAAKATSASEVVRSGIAGGATPDPSRFLTEQVDEPAADLPAAHPSASSALVEEASDRPPSRGQYDWSAPPPWGSEPDRAASGTDDAARAAAAGAAAAGAAAGAASTVDQTGGGPRPDGATSAAADLPLEADAPTFLAQRQAPAASRPPTSTSDDRAAGGPGGRGMPPVDLDDELEAGAHPGGGALEDDASDEPMRRFGPGTGRSRYGAAAARGRPPADPDAPPWERPRKFEAYPTIKSRGSISLSPILIGIGALAIGAAVLFFVPPLLLGLGGSSSSATPTPSVAASPSAGDASPTAIPSPTPQIYIVKSGDTLSKIAKAQGVTLDALIAANQDTLPDPDKLKVGDRIVIPTADQPEPSPSPSPAASPSP